MKVPLITFSLRTAGTFLFFGLISIGVFTACNRLDNVPLHNYQQTNLVADIVSDEYVANRIDVSLVDPWGIAVNPDGPIWISSNGSGVSQVYSNTGAQLIPPVTIPGASLKTIGQPTGVVYNASSDFVIPNTTTISRFIYVGTDGVLSAWGGGAEATLIANNNATAIYTGLAIASGASGANYIYAADFKTGNIDVWDKNFHWVSMPFTDPDLPGGYSPFNITAMHHFLYVAYAKVNPVTHDETKGAGLGLIDVFTTDGMFVKRFASHGTLNAPWGMAASCPGFHSIADAILVGNFGDGRINVFDAVGNYKGQLMSKGAPITIEGLWALASNVPGAQPNQLFFTAGVDDEAHGVFGYVAPQ